MRAKFLPQDSDYVPERGIQLLKEDVHVDVKCNCEDLQELSDPEQSFIETLKSETAADIEGDECQGMKLLYDYCF